MTHLVDSSLDRTGNVRSLIRELQKFNLRHVEQLASILLSHTGRLALDEIAPVHGFGNLDALWELLQQDLANGPRYSLSLVRGNPNSVYRPANMNRRLGTGFMHAGWRDEYDIFSEMPAVPSAEIGDAPDFDVQAFAASLDRTPVVARHDETGQEPRRHLLYPRGQAPQPEDQGTRGTCVAFAITAMIHAFIRSHIRNYSGPNQFSEQFLYYKAKQRDPNTESDGTPLDNALAVLAESGICARDDLYYRNWQDWGHALFFDTPIRSLDALERLALRVRARGHLRVPSQNRVQAIEGCLDRNHAVAVTAGTPFALPAMSMTRMAKRRAQVAARSYSGIAGVAPGQPTVNTGVDMACCHTNMSDCIVLRLAFSRDWQSSVRSLAALEKTHAVV